MEQITAETKRSIMSDFFSHEPRLLDYLEKEGFYEAPASKGHHGAYRGALFDHSLQVTYELQRLTEKLELKWQRSESPVYIGMLHDLCKIDSYKFVQEMASVQFLEGETHDVPTGEEHIEWNRDQMIEGHGEKSCILALQKIWLTDEEIMCIRYHMGAFEGEKKWDKYSNTVRKFPNVLYVHTADMIASQIKEV